MWFRQLQLQGCPHALYDSQPNHIKRWCLIKYRNPCANWEVSYSVNYVACAIGPKCEFVIQLNFPPQSQINFTYPSKLQTPFEYGQSSNGNLSSQNSPNKCCQILDFYEEPPILILKKENNYGFGSKKMEPNVLFLFWTWKNNNLSYGTNYKNKTLFWFHITSYETNGQISINPWFYFIFFQNFIFQKF